MTQQQHCGHEPVCKYAEHSGRDGKCPYDSPFREGRVCSHDTRRTPAPQQPAPFVAMSSTDLIALSEKEWRNRAERKRPAYDKRSWISGWMDGYFSKPQEQQG